MGGGSNELESRSDRWRNYPGLPGQPLPLALTPWLEGQDLIDFHTLCGTLDSYHNPTMKHLSNRYSHFRVKSRLLNVPGKQPKVAKVPGPRLSRGRPGPSCRF